MQISLSLISKWNKPLDWKEKKKSNFPLGNVSR